MLVPEPARLREHAERVNAEAAKRAAERAARDADYAETVRHVRAYVGTHKPHLRLVVNR